MSGDRTSGDRTSGDRTSGDRTSDPESPDADPGAGQPGDRAYEDLPVRGIAQGPLSPGATEPGDMGAPKPDRREERPHERSREDGTGYRG